MDNALGEPQTIVLLGGTSDIGRAIVERLVSPPRGRRARRPPSGGDASRGAEPTRDRRRHGALRRHRRGEPTRHSSPTWRHATATSTWSSWPSASSVDQAELDDDPALAAALVTVNYTGAVSSGLAVAARFRQQGHGRLVVLSSVAGERVRKANFVYGSSKAGLDGFAQGLGDALAGSGAQVLVVRPGFVHSQMTAGMKAAPFATTPSAVAEATVRALRRGRRTVWVPATLRPVFSVFRHLPGAVWRRMPLG